MNPAHLSSDGIPNDGKTAKRRSAFAPPYLQGPEVVNEQGELLHDQVKEDVQGNDTPTVPRPSNISAWAKGPLLALKKVVIAEPHPSPTNQLAQPFSATSIYGTESDPATPWDPVVRRRLEGHDDQIPTGQNPPWTTPTYPWGMPMSPTTSTGQDESLAKIPGGPGVMWTPSGWAVQDAAMKNSLRAAEVKMKDQHARTRKGKSYYKSGYRVVVDGGVGGGWERLKLMWVSSTVQVFRRRVLSPW